MGQTFAKKKVNREMERHPTPKRVRVYTRQISVARPIFAECKEFCIIFLWNWWVRSGTLDVRAVMW
jgi:hypothetical protein